MIVMMFEFKVHDWEEWKKEFIANRPKRDAQSIKTFYFGREKNNINNCHLSLSVPSLEVFEKHLEQNQDHIRRAGVIPESVKITILEE